MNLLEMKVIPVIALLAVPALAQERWNFGLGLNETASEASYLSNDPGTVTVHLKRERKTVPAIHAGYRFHDFASSDLSFTGEYQFQSRATLTALVTEYRGRAPRAERVSGRMKNRFFAPGIQWNFHRAVDFGFGLQYRFTQLEAEDSGFTTNYNRPWLLAYVGYTFKQGKTVRPYVALRVAGSPVTTSERGLLKDLLSSEGRFREKLIKSQAGDFGGSLQVGVRF